MTTTTLHEPELARMARRRAMVPYLLLLPGDHWAFSLDMKKRIYDGERFASFDTVRMRSDGTPQAVSSAQLLA